MHWHPAVVDQGLARPVEEVRVVGCGGVCSCGPALAALRYLGKHSVDEHLLHTVCNAVGAHQFRMLRHQPGAVPAWPGDALWKFEQCSLREEPRLDG